MFVRGLQRSNSDIPSTLEREWPGRQNRSWVVRGEETPIPLVQSVLRQCEGIIIVLKNVTRAALSAAVLLAGFSSGLPASAQGYPPPPPPGYAPPPPGYAPPPGTVLVPSAPPPVRVEAVPPPPPYPAVWQPGFWRWDGYRYRWARGHYVRPPRERHEWVAGHWEVRPGGHFWVEGFWR